MKSLFLVLASHLLLFCPSVRAASPEEETRFVADVKRAFEKHDAEALMKLTCWDRVPEKFKGNGKKQYTREVTQTVTNIVLVNPNPKYPDLEWKGEDGISYRSNLPVAKQLKVSFATGSAVVTKIGKVKVKDTVYPVGEKAGKLYLLEPAPVN